MHGFARLTLELLFIVIAFCPYILVVIVCLYLRPSTVRDLRKFSIKAFGQ